MKEYFDIRDSAGNPTGEVKARSLVHRDGDIHGTSHVWLVRKNKKSGYDVLLQKRSDNKDSFPGCYDISSAGHLPAGADYRESAVRELEEELGIAVSPEEFYGKPFHNHEISAIFILEKNIEPEGMCLQKEEVSGVLWMDFAECLDGIRKNTLCHCIFEDEFETLGEYLGILSKTETT